MNASFLCPYIAIIINPIHPLASKVRETVGPLGEVGVAVGSEALTHAPE